MISHYDIDGSAWVQITNAGESGTCWLVDNVEGDGNCRIYHSTTPPSLDDKIYGYPVNYVVTKDHDASHFNDKSWF